VTDYERVDGFNDRTVAAVEPTAAMIATVLGELNVDPVLIPHDCSDGFLGCFWGRPEAYLDAEARFGMSGVPLA